MQIELERSSADGRKSIRVVDPVWNAWFFDLTGRRALRRADVDLLAKVGVECVVARHTIFWSYDGPLPAPARLFWEAKPST